MAALRPHLKAHHYERKPLNGAGEHRIDVLYCYEVIASRRKSTVMRARASRTTSGGAGGPTSRSRAC